jgi:peptidoglycan/xylan/chitin deacetylase (PgdA/CDA1 family)
MIANLGIGAFILMYHSVDDHSDEIFSVSVQAFREQVSWLYQNGFEVVSLSFLIQALQAHQYERLRKKVVITFDDGYRDFLTNALPVLLERGATATVFIVTDLLGARSSWHDAAHQEPLMTEEEVRFIKAQGIGLGSHTTAHVKLTQLDRDGLMRQLNDSRETLARLGETFHSISYPWGQWNRDVALAAQQCGYRCALSVGEQTRMAADQAYFLPRITMARGMDLKRFGSLLTRTRAEMWLRWRYRNLRERKFPTKVNG